MLVQDLRGMVTEPQDEIERGEHDTNCIVTRARAALAQESQQ
jgi:hypothetical protein